MTSLGDKLRGHSGFTYENRQQIIHDAIETLIDQCEKSLLLRCKKDIYTWTMRIYYETIHIIDREKYDVITPVCEYFECEKISVIAEIQEDSFLLTFDWYPKPMSLTKGINTLS